MTAQTGKTWLLWLLIGLAGCRPADNTLPPLQAIKDTTALENQVDSAWQIKQDGLEHGPLNTDQYTQLPPELSQLLYRDFPGWALPDLPAKALKQLKPENQGPYLVRADFDQNKLKDMAVQFRLGDTVWVVAYLQQRHQPPLKRLVTRQPVSGLAETGRAPGTRPQAGAGRVPVARSLTLLHLAGQNLVFTIDKHSRKFNFKEGRFWPVSSRESAEPTDSADPQTPL